MSPILLVHSGMGPVLIEQGLSDPITHLSQATALLATLQAHNVPARLITFEGGHGVSSAPWNLMAAQDVLPFIESEH